MPGRKLDDCDTLNGIPGRILVVDDEPVVADLVVTVLRAAGHEVASLTDSADVMRTLADGDYEVVITDLSMPGLSGLDLIRRGRERGLDVQWIIFTGTGGYEDAIAAVRHGAYDYMRKPIRDLDLLRTTVARAVTTHRLAADRRRLVDLVANRNRLLSDQMTAMEDALGVRGTQARELAEDHDHARQIELSLLPPKLPYTDRISFHAFYHASQRVGGDLYDVMRIGPHHIAAYVADAAGHGVSAAMMAVLVKQCIQPAQPGSPGVPQPPAAVLDALTQRINRQTEDTCLFVSLAYLLVDTRDLSAVFASAGHPAAVLMSEDRSARRLTFTGPAIGVQPDPIYREVKLQLTEGDRLLVFTDGLTEVRNRDGAFFSHEGICAAMDEHHDDPDHLVPQLIQRANRFGGGAPFDDDVTMLMLSVDGMQHGKIHKQRSRSKTKRPDSEPAHIQIVRNNSRLLVCLAGPGSWSNCAAVNEACYDWLRPNRTIIIDLAEAAYVDTTFLATLLEIQTRAAEVGAEFHIQDVCPAIRIHLDELGLTSLLQCITTVSNPPPTTRGTMLGTFVDA